MLRNLFVILFAMMLAFAMIGCEGEQGPEGPAGPAGPEGPQGPAGEDGEDAPTPPDYTYLGTNGDACAHCHSGVVDGWTTTGHSMAYDALEEADRENPYCLKCHVTGVEVESIEAIAFGDTEFPEGDNPDGYDDYFGVDTEEAAMRRAALEGVQCEACHGPLGPEAGFGGAHAEVELATYIDMDGNYVSACYPCHERQLDEWSESGHAMSEGGDVEALNDHFGRGSCAGCHTGEGFIAANDPAYAGYSGDYSFVGCTACHDPHSTENEYQLRNVGDVHVEYHLGYDPEEDPSMGTMSGKGAGQTCAQCHHARRNTDNVLGQIAEGYAHFGPHGSPQMDMFIGYGSYEIEGYTYDRTTVHQTAIADACVSCHMVRFEELHGDEANHVYHQFAPQGAACYPCHDFAPDDFDYQSVQTNTAAKMDELAQALGYSDFADFSENFDSQADGVTVEEREAAYALVFVGNDGSLGVHNSAYSGDLLQNAIDHLNTLP